MLALNRQFQQAIWQNNLPATPVASTAWGTALTAHATPHSKGAWVTLMTTTYAVYGFWLGLTASSSTGVRTDMMLDIAIGDSQQNIILPELLCGWVGSVTVSPRYIWVPIYIPAGTLVSGRIQALITVDTLQVLMYANGGASSYPGTLFSGCHAYGTDIASSGGTSHTPGNSASESTPADIGAATSRQYGAVLFAQNGTLANTTMLALTYHWEILIGGVTCCELWTQTGTAEAVAGPFPPAPFLMSIPTGTQLQVRGECSGTAQAQDVAFYCFW